MTCNTTHLANLAFAIALLASPFAASAQNASAVEAAAVPIFTDELAANGMRPAATAAAETFILDDGQITGAYGVFKIPTYDYTLDGVWLNRFTVGHGVTLKHITIFWPPEVVNVDPTWNVGLVAYYDADMDGNPRNAVRLGSDTVVTVGALSQWKTYAVNFTVPAAGDVYVGFVDLWAQVPGGWPLPLKYIASISDNNPQCRSYALHQATTDFFADFDNLDNNDVMQILTQVDDSTAPTNLMIRADGDPLGGDAIFKHGFDNLSPCVVASARTAE